MRKLALGVGAISLCFALVLPATADPGFSTRAEARQFAFADWIDMNGMTGNFYGAWVWRSTDSFWSEQIGPETFAIVFRGKCRVHNRTQSRGSAGSADSEASRGDKGGKSASEVSVIVCSGWGYGVDVLPQDFLMDPLLSSARLHVETGRHTHDVTWTGRSDGPDRSHSVVARGTRASADVFMARMAKPEGKVFGERMKPGWMDLGFLYQSVDGQVRLSSGGLDIDVMRDGRVKVTRRIVIER